MKAFVSDKGTVICGDSFSKEVGALLSGKQFHLIIMDPPYGGIVKEKWDVADYANWMARCDQFAARDCAIIMFGGIGKRKNRPFLQFAASVETTFPDWEIKNWITWGKKRAYGVQDDYLFCREEFLYLRKGKPTFNVPLLDKERGYEGYNPKYKAHSKFLRRTNVWTDITELLRGKIHVNQKPDKLYEVIINTHSKPGDCILDLAGGSLTTMRAATNTGRSFFVVEQYAEFIQKAGVELR